MVGPVPSKKVWHLQPWFAKDFVVRALADRYAGTGRGRKGGTGDTRRRQPLGHVIQGWRGVATSTTDTAT